MIHISRTYHFFSDKIFIYWEAKSSVFGTPQTSLLALVILRCWTRKLSKCVTHFKSFQVQRLHFALLVIEPLTLIIQHLSPSSWGLKKTSGPSCKSTCTTSISATWALITQHIWVFSDSESSLTPSDPTAWACLSGQCYTSPKFQNFIWTILANFYLENGLVIYLFSRKKRI